MVGVLSSRIEWCCAVEKAGVVQKQFTNTNSNVLPNLFYSPLYVSRCLYTPRPSISSHEYDQI